MEGDGVADADAEAGQAHGPSINRRMGSRLGGQRQSPRLQTHMPSALEAGVYQRQTQMGMGMALMGENQGKSAALGKVPFSVQHVLVGLILGLCHGCHHSHQLDFPPSLAPLYSRSVYLQ